MAWPIGLTLPCMATVPSDCPLLEIVTRSGPQEKSCPPNREVSVQSSQVPVAGVKEAIDKLHS